MEEISENSEKITVQDWKNVNFKLKKMAVTEDRNENWGNSRIEEGTH